MSKKGRRIFARITVFLLLAVTALILIRYRSPYKNEHTLGTASPAGELEVHFIDVGQGDAILVEENDTDMLIDAGNNDKGNLVADYLKAHNITDLDYVIGTHPHSDHIGGMDTILAEFPTKDVILPAVDNKTKSFHDVLKVIKVKNIKVTYAKAGDRYRFGDASFLILAPNSASYTDMNDYSVCIKLIFGQNSFLFAADSEELSEREMLTSGYDLSADVLKLGHHGSAYSSCNDFLDAVHPAYGIISAGKDNENGHPHLRTLRAMQRYGISIYRTDLQGTLIFTSNGRNITVNKPAYDMEGSMK